MLLAGGVFLVGDVMHSQKLLEGTFEKFGCFVDNGGILAAFVKVALKSMRDP